MKLVFLITFGIFLLALNTGCVYSMARYDGPYEGRMVDADTGNPIEGVVILGVWYKVSPTVAGAVSSYYDAEETVTDKNGDFKIPGKGLKILSKVSVMDVVIFKEGYEYISLTPWQALKIDAGFKVKWDGNKAIIPLKKLTMEQRKKRLFGKGGGEIPDEKQKLLIRESNKESIALGLTPYAERY